MTIETLKLDGDDVLVADEVIEGEEPARLTKTQLLKVEEIDETADETRLNADGVLEIAGELTEGY